MECLADSWSEGPSQRRVSGWRPLTKYSVSPTLRAPSSNPVSAPGSRQLRVNSQPERRALVLAPPRQPSPIK